MSFVDDLIARGEAKPRRVIEIEHRGEVLRFNLPYGGIERAKFRRKSEAFVKEMTSRPNATFVQKGLAPDCGFPEDIAAGLFMLHSMSDPQWSQEQVLAMYAANPDEVTAIAGALSSQALELMAQDAQGDYEQKKEPSDDSDLSSSTSAPA